MTAMEPSLSDEILEAGYGIYSTICIIRDHNEWARQNQDKLQQCFLMTAPRTAAEGPLSIRLMDGFFEEQFRVNDGENARSYWQVYDRTTDEELASEGWSYDAENGCVYHRFPCAVPYLYGQLHGLSDLGRDFHVQPHHQQLRDKEHLMQIDSHVSGNQGISAGLDEELVRNPSGNHGGALHLHVLQFCLDLGKR